MRGQPGGICEAAEAIVDYDGIVLLVEEDICKFYITMEYVEFKEHLQRIAYSCCNEPQAQVVHGLCSRKLQ